MNAAATTGSNRSVFCQRSFGRAELALRTAVATTSGTVRCLVVDLSLGGAKIQPEYPIEADSDVWLTLGNLKVFGTVRWANGDVVGIQFDEKLPKAFILHLQGDSVDPDELEAAEALLAARDWVVGKSSDCTKSERLAKVLGRASDASATGAIGSPSAEAQLRTRLGPSRQRSTKRLVGRAPVLVALSALLGGLIGMASLLFF